MLLDIVGVEWIPSRLCDADATLSLPTELAKATITTFSGATASVNATVIVAVVPLTDVVLGMTVPSDALRT